MEQTPTRRGTVVYPQESDDHRTIRAYAPSERLAPFIEYFWVVRWDLDRPHISQTIPQPRIHLTVEGDQVLVYGIDRAQFRREISGSGVVLGVAFRPAGFRAFTDSPLNALRDRVVPAGSVLRANPAPPTFVGPPDAELVAYAEALLVAQEPTIDPMAQWCEELVNRADVDRTITRVRQLADIANVSERSLQRRFGDYVGASPKWVIQRSRIMNLVADCNEGKEIDWPAAAITLGFADQAHLIRTFGEIVGVSPEQYRKRVMNRLERS